MDTTIAETMPDEYEQPHDLPHSSDLVLVSRDDSHPANYWSNLRFRLSSHRNRYVLNCEPH